MTRTSLSALVGTALFVAAAAAILTARFYGSMLAIPATVSISLWAMALVCVLLILKVRSAKNDEHGIGLDNSQLNPMTIAQFLLVGRPRRGRARLWVVPMPALRSTSSRRRANSWPRPGMWRV